MQIKIIIVKIIFNFTLEEINLEINTILYYITIFTSSFLMIIVSQKIFLKYNLPIEFKELMFVIHGVVLSSSCENTKFLIEP